MKFSLPSKQNTPTAKATLDPKAVAAFAAAADEPGQARVTVKSNLLPWDGLDDKYRKPVFSMRFTDAEKAKLKYLTDAADTSMHDYCFKAVMAQIERDLMPESQVASP